MALNRWVMAEAGRQPELGGMATMLTALVPRGRRQVFAHVGDSRLCLLRAGVLRVTGLPAQNPRDALTGAARLPLPPRFRPSQEFDGLRIDELLHDSRATLFYRVTDQLSGQALVLETLRRELADDPDEMRALVIEEWRARRIVLPAFLAHLVPTDRRADHRQRRWRCATRC